MHREAVKGYYEKQVQSKYYRHLEKTYGPLFQQEKLYKQLHVHHFKRFYNGKPTKRYLKVMAQIAAAAKISERDLINAMLR